MNRDDDHTQGRYVWARPVSVLHLVCSRGIAQWQSAKLRRRRSEESSLTVSSGRSGRGSVNRQRPPPFPLWKGGESPPSKHDAVWQLRWYRRKQ